MERMVGERRIAIVGGGVTGLAAAYQIEQEANASDVPLRGVLFEATGRLGGKIQTERVDGHLFEEGPDSLLARKIRSTDLLSRLGLAESLVESNPRLRGAFVVHRGRLEPLPESTLFVAPYRVGPLLTTRILSPWGKARALLDLVLPGRVDDSDESLEALVSRRLGREVARRLAIPLLASVYGGGSGDLSVLAAFPELRQLEQKHRSLLKGQRILSQQRKRAQPGSPFVTLSDGLASLIDRLSGALRSTEIVQSGQVTELHSTIAATGQREYRLRLADGRDYLADAVILATPADVTSRLLRDVAPIAARSLGEIDYLPALVVTVGFERKDVKRPLAGTGFLVPADERLTLIASTWVSQKWPHASPADSALFRCYLGGPSIQNLLERDDADLVRLACAELGPLVGIEAAPRLSRVYRWPSGLPRYAPGHLDRVRSAEDALREFPGLVLAGAAYRGIGVPDCIRQGQEAARTALSVTSARVSINPAEALSDSIRSR